MVRDFVDQNQGIKLPGFYPLPMHGMVRPAAQLVDLLHEEARALGVWEDDLPIVGKQEALQRVQVARFTLYTKLQIIGQLIYPVLVTGSNQNRAQCSLFCGSRRCVQSPAADSV